MALKLNLALLAFDFMQERAELSISSSLFSVGCTEDYVDDVDGDEEVLQLTSLIDSRCRPEGPSGGRYKTTGARVEARAVGTT